MTTQFRRYIVDLGNVIIAHWLSKISKENFNEIDYNSIPEVPGAFEALKQLNELSGGKVLVVYNATDTATEKILGWLVHHRFTERTGIPMERVVRTVRGRDKTVHLSQFSYSHGQVIVIDDRLEVLSYFVGKAQHLFLFCPQQDEIEQFKHTGALSHVQVVQTWEEILQILHV